MLKWWQKQQINHQNEHYTGKNAASNISKTQWIVCWLLVMCETGESLKIKSLLITLTKT